MKVLIAEDDELHRAFLRSAVENALPECEEVVEVEDGSGVIDALAKNDLKLIIMDLQMPGINGVDAAKEVWRLQSGAKILFWSNYADEAYVRGVARIVPKNVVYGYLLKSASEERLELAVRGVFLEDQCIIDREIRGIQQRSENSLDGLSDHEYEVLTDIALGMTDKTIAARREISTRAVQSRLKQLYEKLGIGLADNEYDISPLYNSRTRAVMTAFSRGLLNVDALTNCEEKLKTWLSSRRIL